MAASAVEPATTEGPVLSLIHKRLRALRKKLNRIAQMEESLAQGKTLNREQEETLRSKPSVLAAIDELEKLRAPLQEAVAQEIELGTKENQAEIAAEEAPEATETSGDISDLLKLLYFASVFDVKTLVEARDNMLTRTHERNCCLTYDYVTDDDADFKPLKEGDLDVIAKLGGLLLSRPVGSSLSHKDALEMCAERAKLWIGRSWEETYPGSGVTYAGLRDKLDKIMASEYFTTTPEIKAPVEVAAAAENYASFQVISPVGETLQVEDPVSEHQQMDDQSPESHVIQYAGETDHVEELQQGLQETENAPEMKVQTPTVIDNVAETNQGPRESDFKENNQTNHRYNQNYYRGGRGRRGAYYNGGGRGGRGGMGRGNYQNGRGGGQFYDVPGGHYQMNYNGYYRGEGGGRGNGGNYKYHGLADNVQVASSA